jgi:hypothetical protein
MGMSKATEVLAAIHATDEIEATVKRAMKHIEKVLAGTKSPRARALLDEAYYKLGNLAGDIEVERQFLLGEYVEYCKQK